MKILNVADYTIKMNEMASQKRVAQEVGDFFRMLETRNGTFAYLYYANDWTPYMNKKIELNGVKQPNPMLGRIFKISAYRFQAGKEYYKRLEQLFPGYTYDPDVPMNQEQIRKTGWRSLPDPGKPCQENEKTGEIALPVVEPKSVWNKWVMIDDKGTPVEVEYDDVLPYIKQPKLSASSTFRLDYKRFYVNKIYMLNGGGKTFKNTVNFAYPILAPLITK